MKWTQWRVRIIEKLGYFPDDDEVVKVRFEGYLLQPTEIQRMIVFVKSMSQTF